ncbi:MAG: hypothetical protein WA087_00515 [Candidatus Saccharimonadales bacterium]
MTSKKIIKIIKNDAADITEPLLDEGVSTLMKDVFGVVVPELAKDIPILKSVKTATDIYSAIRLTRLSKRMASFARALQLGDFNIDDLNNLPKEEQVILIDTVVTELDNHTDTLQSEALGYLFKAYVSGKIDRLAFTGIAHELKNTNPLVFYFNVDGYTTKQPPKLPPNATNDGFVFTTRKYGTTIDSGPVDYLPAAFKSNSSSVMQFTTETILTNLGEVFFEYVYNPMKKLYVI